MEEVFGSCQATTRVSEEYGTGGHRVWHCMHNNETNATSYSNIEQLGSQVVANEHQPDHTLLALVEETTESKGDHFTKQRGFSMAKITILWRGLKFKRGHDPLAPLFPPPMLAGDQCVT